MGLNIKDIAAPSAGASWDPEVGDQLVGTIINWKMQSPKPNYNKTAMEQEVRLDIQEDNGQVTSVWAVVNTDVEGNGYPSRLAKAIAAAVRESGAEELDNGARIALARIQDGEPPQKGFSAPKDYACRYTPPKAPGLALGSLGDPVQPAGTAQVAAPMPAAADPFAGLMGEPVPVAGLIQPKIQPQFIDRASAIFGLEASALNAMTPAGIGQLVKDKGVANGDALQLLTTLYGDHTIALTAVASAYGQPQAAPAADPLAALLGG